MKINTINRIAWLIFLIDQIKHTRCVEEVAEIDNFGNGDANHCRVALYTSVVAIAAGHIRELEYPGHIGELGYPEPIGKRKTFKTLRTETPFIMEQIFTD